MSEIRVDTISEKTSANGVSIDGLTIKDGGITATTGTIVFNEASADVDFRVESNGNANMFVVDGGLDVAAIGGAVDTEATLLIHTTITDDNTGLTIKGAGSGTGARLAIADAGSNLGTRAETLEFGYDNSTDFIFSRTGQDLIIGTNSAERMRILSGGTISTGGDTSPDVGHGGIGLNQGDNDDNIFTLKSSDVAHGFTGVDDTDTFAAFKKFNGGNGGLQIKGYTDDIRAVVIEGFVNGVIQTEATNAGGAVMIDTHKRSGTGTADFGGDDNLFCVLMNNDTRFIVKGDGELFSDQSATVGTYDAYEDAQLVRAFDLNHMQGVINSKFDKFVQYNKDDLKKAKLIGTDDDGNATPFVNVTGMQRLHNGAIWQQYEKTERLANAMYELAKAAVGEDKANEILKQNEIKLLN